METSGVEVSCCEQFGVTWENMAAGMERFLVQRCCTNGIDLSALSQLNGANDELVSCVATDRRKSAPGQVFGN